MVTVIGIDCAAQARDIGMARALWDGRRAAVTNIENGARGRSVVATIREWVGDAATVLLALDAPLGWPKALGLELVEHMAGMPVGTPPNAMFRRETDLRVWSLTGRLPLDVGADKIARTAHAALGLLGDLAKVFHRPICLAWDRAIEGGVHAIEVYPAGTLRMLALPSSGYKQADQRPVRQEILTGLREELDLRCDTGLAETDPDVLDALVCVLAAQDFLSGKAHPPDQRVWTSAKKEGWIWARGDKPRRRDHES